MKNRGFTLVELLSVMTILGILALIIIPAVTSTLNKSREDAYQKQIHILETASEQWGLENLNILPEGNELLTIDFGILYKSGKIADDVVINPKTKKELTGCILISYSEQYKQYTYQYIDNDSICTENKFIQ